MMRVHPRRAVWALLALFTVFYALMNLSNMGGLEDASRMSHPAQGNNNEVNNNKGKFEPPKPRRDFPSKWFWTRGLQAIHPDIFPVKSSPSSSSSTTTTTTPSPVARLSRSRESVAVWPSPGNRTDDRIVAQMKFVPAALKRNVLSAAQRRPKLILWHPNAKTADSGMRRFYADNCPVKNCFISNDLGLSPVADAILFANTVLSAEAVRRLEKPQHQVWIQYMLESPANNPSYQHLRGMVNWTATYRTDSTIVTPYEKFVPFPNASHVPKSNQNFAKGKTKKVAWFVSNCQAGNNRFGYAQELAKHIQVDIFGSCSKMSCPRDRTDRCFHMLKNDYKFYLAFENSNCRDYITEKLYWNALQNDVIPVVMGAPREDYEYAAPPGSFIYADDFETPLALAQYLMAVDANDTLYNEFFRWKGTGEFVNTYFYCRLCAMLHDDEAPPTWYGDFHGWWARDQGATCIKRSHTNPYASWRIHRHQPPKFKESVNLVSKATEQSKPPHRNVTNSSR